MDGYPKTYEQAKDLFAGKVYAAWSSAWSGSGREGGRVMIPHSRYFFTLVPHPALVFIAFADPVFCFQKTYRRFDKTNFATKANKCKI